MKLQLLSDLHLETESWEPRPAADAELLVLGGDIDSSHGWPGYRQFANWPVPVLVIAGNHEFDDRDFDAATAGLRGLCAELNFTFLERQELLFTSSATGRRLRVLGTTRWSDFDLFGEAQRPRAERAAAYFMRRMACSRNGEPFGTDEVRSEAQACRSWLEGELARPAQGRWDKTVVVTHFAPSLRSADPRFGSQPGTAGFCNADDELIPRADLWLHGHLHCRHDYFVGRTRVVCNSRGLASKGEAEGHDGLLTLDI